YYMLYATAKTSKQLNMLKRSRTGRDRSVLPRVDPQFDRWYLAVTCDKCSSKVILFRDLNEGKSDLHGTRYSLRCPRCKSWANGKAERYRHRERRRPEVSIEIL